MPFIYLKKFLLLVNLLGVLLFIVICEEAKTEVGNASTSTNPSSSTRYSCLDKAASNTCHPASDLDDCQKDQTDPLNVTWRWKYFREQVDNFVLEHPESSVDELLSNTHHVVSVISNGASDIYKIDVDPKIDKKLEMLAAGTGEVDDKLCGEHLRTMLSLMKELNSSLEEKRASNCTKGVSIEEKHLRLATVLDSYGKYGAGLLAGRILFLGSYEQCVKSWLELDENGRTSMRYCTARLRVDEYLHPDLLRLPKTPHQPETVINVAICVPRSCHTKSFHANKELFKKLVESQFQLPKSIYLKNNLELDSVFCLIDKGSPLTSISISGYLLVLFIAIWTILVVFATLSDKINQESKSWILRHLVKSLDLSSSWSNFKAESSKHSTTASRINLDTLNPIKVLACLVVMIGHAMLGQMFTVMDKLRAYHIVEYNSVATFISALTTTVVDSFFVISGMILVLNALKKINEPKKGESVLGWFAKNCAKQAGNRYLRLVPLYALVFWFKKSIFPYIGSGPSWDYGYNRKNFLGACRLESWLTPFTGAAAFTPMSLQCMPQAWSVAGDIFFSLVLSPIPVLMVVKPKLTALIAIILCLGSNLAMLKAFTNLEPAIRIDLENLRVHGFMRLFNNYSFLYSSPIYRAFSTLVGMLAGYILYHYEQNKKLREWPSWFKGPLTKLSLITTALIIVAPSILNFVGKDLLLKRMDLFYSSMTTNRLIFALANAVIFLRLVTDWKDSCLSRACAGRFWRIVVKLNFALLLLHFDIYYFDSMNESTIKIFSIYRSWAFASSVYLPACLMGLILNVAFENPIDKFIRGLWDRMWNQINDKKIDLGASRKTFLITKLSTLEEKDCLSNNIDNKKLNKSKKM